MKRALVSIGCFTTAFLQISHAVSADWSVRSLASERISVNDNLGLDEESPGMALGSLTLFSVNALADMPTSEFRFDTDANYQTYTGPGADDALNGLSYGSRASYRKKRKLTNYDVGAFFRSAPIAQDELAEFGQVTSEGQRLTYGADGGFTRQLSRRDTLAAAMAWRSTAGQSSPEEEEFTSLRRSDFTSLSADSTWLRKLDEATSVGASVGWSNTTNPDDRSGSGTVVGSQEESEDEDTVLWTVVGNLAHQFNHRLSVNGSAGLSIADGPGAELLFLSEDEIPLQENGDTGPVLGWIADVALNYSLKTTTFSLFAARSISPSTFGELQSSQSVGFAVAQAINSRSRLILTSRFSMASGGGATLEQSEARDYFSSAVTYSHALTRNWNTNLSYVYTERKSDDSYANSNAVYLSLTRHFTLLP